MKNKFLLFFTLLFTIISVTSSPANALNSKDKTFLNYLSNQSRIELETYVFDILDDQSQAYSVMGTVDEFLENKNARADMIKVANNVCKKISSTSSTSKSKTTTYALNYVNSIVDALSIAGDGDDYVMTLTYLVMSYKAVTLSSSKYGYCPKQSNKMKSVLITFDTVYREKMATVFEVPSDAELDPSVDDTVAIE